jgi:hypothetical protein
MRGGVGPRPFISTSGGFVDYSTFTSVTPEGPDPGEGDSSFSMGREHPYHPRKFGLPFREMKVRIGIDAGKKPSSRIILL